jgi:mannose-6-phosphate isomerase
VQNLYPIRLEASLHETIWGGRRLERDGWKRLPQDNVVIGEAWETEISNIVQNGPYAGKTLSALVAELGPSLLGTQTIEIFGLRFPLLAKFIDANARLSVQVHPDDSYARAHEGGKLGKTEFWYILAAEPGASIVHGFKAVTSRTEVEHAIQNVTLEHLLHEEVVQPGDVIYVPAGTVHAIGSGVLLYELQEYSDITYRMYDYGRLTTAGKPRELHIERSLDVARYAPSKRIKMRSVALSSEPGCEERCLVACRYFVTRELHLEDHCTLADATGASCVILTSLEGSPTVWYPGNDERSKEGDFLRYASETLESGQTMVLPAALGRYVIDGPGTVLRSYVPAPDDEAWQLWRAANDEA